jgi:hypothetical protein
LTHRAAAACLLPVRCLCALHLAHATTPPQHPCTVHPGRCSSACLPAQPAPAACPQPPRTHLARSPPSRRWWSALRACTASRPS